MKAIEYSKSRYHFIKVVADQLAQENSQYQYSDIQSFSHVKNAFLANGLPVKTNQIQQVEHGRPSRCQTSKCRKFTRLSCSHCGKHICKDHKIQVVKCNDCDQ